MKNKNTKKIFIALILTLSVFTREVPLSLGAYNLVENGSFRESTADESLSGLLNPSGWFHGGYGDNSASFIYPVNGADDEYAARIEMSDYVDGDAKWYFADVSVVSGLEYKFKGFYRSDTNVSVVVRFNSGNCLIDNNCLYQELTTQPLAPSEEWSDFAFYIDVPDQVSSITVFVSISTKGWLEIDDISLQESDKVVVDGVPNNSVETASSDNSLPVGWRTNVWGNNSTVFSYMSGDAPNGDRYLRIEMSDYVDGDAKWMYDSQPVVSGSSNQVSIMYRADTDVFANIQYIKGDGSIFYSSLPRPLGVKGEWNEYKESFVIPSNVSSYSVFLSIANNGYLEVDNYHIKPYQYVGFKSPIITLTFDDGAESNIKTVFPVLNSFNMSSVQCYSTAFIEGSLENIENVRAFRNAGHEICSHTVSHPDLTKINLEELNYELEHSQDYLKEITGESVSSFASPFGEYNDNVLNKINDYYQVHRTVDEGFNSLDNLDIRRLKVQNMNPETTLDEFKGWVNKAIADKTWLILVYHRVDDSNLNPFDTYTNDFKSQIEWLSGQEIEVLRIDDALSKILGNPVTLTVSASVEDKVYDGTTKASAYLSLNGVKDGDDVRVLYSSANFVDVEVGSNKDVVISGITLDGADADQYLLSDSSVVAVANIIKRLGERRSSSKSNSSGVSVSYHGDEKVLGVSTTSIEESEKYIEVIGGSKGFYNFKDEELYFVFINNLGIGSVGNDVVELQKRLKFEGVYFGPVTGYYGQLTFEGVKAYQARNNIEQVGVVGPVTRVKLNEWSYTDKSHLIQQKLNLINKLKELLDLMIILERINK